MSIIVSSKAKQRFRTVAALIVVLALFITVYEVNKDKKPNQTVDFRESNRQFDNLKFINKAKVNFSTANSTQAQDEIAKIMEEKGKKRIRKEDGSNYGAYIFTVENDLIHDIVENLREIGSVGSTIEHIDTALVNLDYDSEHSKLMSYEAELKDLGNVRFPSELQNKRKEDLHALIQSARNNMEKLREDDSTLLYITLIVAGKQYKGFDVIINYGLIFIKWLVILFAARVLIVVIANLIVDLLNVLGIKGQDNQGAYTGYYSRYAERGKSHRKVKRVYKDKDAKPENLEDNNK